MINPITMIKNLFKIGKLLSVDDSGNLRFGIVSALGKEQRVLMFSPYGLMHNPPKTSLVLMLQQQGQESNGIGIADDPRNRTLKDLKEGEVALGNYLTSDHMVFKDGELVELNVGNKFTVNAPNVEVNSESAVVNSETVDVNATTVTTVATDVEITSTTLTHNGTNIGDDHEHPQGNDSDGDVQQNTGGPQ